MNVNESPLSGSSFLQTGAISEAEREFINFISEHQRSYGTKEEYNFRLSVFEENYNFAKKHNAEGHSYTLGVTSLSDWTEYEYKKLNGYRPDLRRFERQEATPKFVGSIPDAIDWRDFEAVTDVKNQGSCGSCWAFSTTGSMEGLNAIQNGSLLSFSEQELVDCDKGLTENHGCNGGLMDTAFQWLETHGLALESAYSYTGRGNESCESFTAVFFNTAFQDVTSNDPNALQNAVAIGPVSVAIEADKMVFQLYTGGVIDSTNCGTNLDHGVLVCGYGHDSTTGQDYWLLKNSWGTSWGESGFFRILRDMTTTGAGICGLQSQPSYPTL